MKTVRRFIQVAICFLIIHSCADDWIKQELATDNKQDIKTESLSEKYINKTDNGDGKGESSNLSSKGKQPLNVLVIGTDQRGTEESRADTIMVAQYNPGAKTAKVLSIMRDSYVFIPGHGKSKINHAYAWGGDELLRETIEENFQVQTDHVVKINFRGFVTFVDKMLPQGIEVEVPAEMINYWKWDMEPGKQALNGQQLLNYVRFRKDSENDFGRVKRQQEVLGKFQVALMEKLTSGEGIKTVSSLMKEGKKAVETDIELGDLLQFGMSTMIKPVESFDSLRIPIQDSYRNVLTKEDGQVLELDEEVNAEAAAKFLEVKY
ncbi:LCP family protein [Bacillus salacetis]|uniref:LCP family protein n=1 Tax=Bacillus salacetis TaxID=2315464 RepID=UPI003BA08386